MKDIAAWNEGDWIAAIGGLALFAVLMIGGLLSARKSEEVVGHPRGLFVLFYAEMWERFSYSATCRFNASASSQWPPAAS